MKIWEQSEAYREYYQTGAHDYNESKILLTLQNAIEYGARKYAGEVHNTAAEGLNDTAETKEKKAERLNRRKEYTEWLAKRCGPVVFGMYRYIITNSFIEQPEIALFTALHTIGVLSGRIWETPRLLYRPAAGGTRTIPENTTTDYLTVLAATGHGKEAVKTVIDDFLEGLDILRITGATTKEALYVQAMKYPRCIFVQDEAGRKRQAVGSGRGDPYGQKSVETFLMEIYANRARTILPPAYSEGKDNPNLKAIKRNGISSLLLSNPATYQDALQSDDTGSGYLARQVVVYSDRDRPEDLGPSAGPEAAEYQAWQNEELLRPYKEWQKYHVGLPDCDTYGQLIRPYLAAAWKIAGAYDRIKEARKTAYEMRDGTKKQKYTTNRHLIYDEGQPADVVVWGPGTPEAVRDIYRSIEAGVKNDPATIQELATRLLHHILICGMQIAIANSPLGRTRPPTQDEIVDADEAEAAGTAASESAYAPIRPQHDTPTQNEDNATNRQRLTRQEAARYAGATTIYEIETAAGKDEQARKDAWTALKKAIAKRERIEAAAKKEKKKEGKADTIPDDEEQPAASEELQKTIADIIPDDEEPPAANEELKKAIAEETKAREVYDAKVYAIEVAVKEVYTGKRVSRHPLVYRDTDPIRDYYGAGVMHPTTEQPMITIDHLYTAYDIIITLGFLSSAALLHESIPGSSWYELKQNVIEILKKHPDFKIPKSKLDQRIAKKVGDRFERLIEEMEADCMIELGPVAKNGGQAVYLFGHKPKADIPSTETKSEN